ncbi:MAG: toxic anion resistance protein [Candidatus Pacebacteria bacterium]|nr:toxic anion resistance protein [Candidatus Paceibacterota bacterium]
MIQTQVQPAQTIAPQVANAAQVAQDMGIIPGEQLATVKVNPETERVANEWLKKVMACDVTNAEQTRQTRDAVENIAAPLVQKLANKSAMLKKQISVLSQSAESSPVANALVNLKVQVDTINPNKFKLLEPGSVGRFFSIIPGVGTTLNQYFTRWQSAGSVIDSIVVQLHSGADQLRRDNDILADDQVEMRDLTLRLQKTIQAAMLLDTKLAAEIDKLEQGSEQRKFLEEEVLFTLRQSISDRQTNLAVNQQGVISYELIIRNNRELIRCARRCEEVTVKALEIAVVVAMALANQRIVLKTVQAVDKTTADLMVQNSIMLKTQGVEIHKMAAGQNISMDALKQVFGNLTQAMEDISRFKQEALPQMAGRILEMDRMSTETEKVIAKMERGNAQRPTISLDLEASGAPNK